MVASGSKRIAKRADRRALEQRVTAFRDHHRIEHDVRGFPVREPVGDRDDRARLPEHADLRRVDAHVGEQRIDLQADELGATPAGCRSPRCVFCAVSAATTAHAYAPFALIAFTSARMPAPPDGSTPAIVRTFGIR